MAPSAVPFATPCSSEVAVTELPFDALLVDLPPVSAIASEKLPPVAVALALPRPFTSASAKLLSPVALECALPFPAELAKHSLPSTPLWSILLLFFTAHTDPAAACARAVANVKSIAAINPIVAFRGLKDPLPHRDLSFPSRLHAHNDLAQRCVKRLHDAACRFASLLSELLQRGLLLGGVCRFE
jgi:hypothetical protein